MKGSAPQSISALQALLATGQTSCEQLAQGYLESIARHTSWNAFSYLDPSRVLAQAAEADLRRARGEPPRPLEGVFLAIKDNIHVAGIPNSAGTPALRHFIPAHDSALVAHLRAAGAMVLGKTNMHELALGVTSNNYAFGAVANPAAPQQIAGGSSGGTACAVAAGMAPAGLGTDTGGSVRIPAALTGVYGFRPSTGRYPRQGITPISVTRDTAGPIANSLEDIALLDRAICPREQVVEATDINRLRLGVPRAYFYSPMDEPIRAAIEHILQRLQKAGATLVEADIPDLEPLNRRAAFGIAFFELLRDLPKYLLDAGTGVEFNSLLQDIASPDVRKLLNPGTLQLNIPAAQYHDGLKARSEMIGRYRDYFDRHDLDMMVVPTTLLAARPIATSLEQVDLNGVPVPTFDAYIHNSDPTSIIGCPGLSVPVGFTKDGLPIGLEFDGRIGEDRKLLADLRAIDRIIRESKP